LQALVDDLETMLTHHDEHGWDELDEEAHVLRRLLEARQQFRQAELDRARVVEERKRRKLTLALAAAVLLLVLAGGSGAWLVQQQHAAGVARQQEAEFINEGVGTSATAQ
jgi:hypothetical protein